MLAALRENHSTEFHRIRCKGEPRKKPW